MHCPGASLRNGQGNAGAGPALPCCEVDACRKRYSASAAQESAQVMHAFTTVRAAGKQVGWLRACEKVH